MALPTFRSLATRRKQQEAEGASDGSGQNVRNSNGSEKATSYTPAINIKLATKTRRNWIILSSLLFFVSVIFLILVRPPASLLRK